MNSTSALCAALALVGGVEITPRDADELRALVSPPPPRAAAERLAVDAARAHFWLRGWVEHSSPRARLEAYRVLIATARRSSRDVSHLAGQVAATLAHADAEAGIASRAVRGAAGHAPGTAGGRRCPAPEHEDVRWHPPLARIAPPMEEQWLADLLPEHGPAREVSLLRTDPGGGVEVVPLGAVHPHQLTADLRRQLVGPPAPLRLPTDRRGRSVVVVW